MTDIIVRPLDEVYVQVEAEQYILQELREKFSFYVPGYFHMPKFKNTNWDGKIYLFNTYTNMIYRGLVDALKQFAVNNGYSIESHADIEHEISKEEVVEFCKTLNLTSDGVDITPRLNQYLSVYFGLKYGKNVFVSPTASGKSLILYVLSRWHLTHNRRVLIVTNTTNLVNQMKGDFVDYAFKDKWNAEQAIHLVYTGQEKVVSNPIVITTWQSCVKFDQSYLNSFDVVIVDEAHGAQSNSMIKILTSCNQVKYRYGFTGTLQDAKAHKYVIEGLLGKAYYLKGYKDLMDSGELTTVRIEAVKLKYKKGFLKLDHQQEQKLLVGLPERNTFIATLAASCPKNVFVISHYVKHLKDIAKRVAKLTDRRVFVITGAMSGEDRNAIREQIESETDAIVLATYGVFSTGINIKNLHYGIFASEYKSKTKVLQSIGRGLRLHPEKKEFVLYDLVDDLEREDDNYALKHFKERLALYTREGFNVNMSKIVLG